MITNEQLEALIRAIYSAAFLDKGGSADQLQESVTSLRAAFAEQKEVRHKVTCKLFPDPYDEREPVGPCTCGAIPSSDDALNAARWRKLFENFEAISLHEGASYTQWSKDGLLSCLDSLPEVPR